MGKSPLLAATSLVAGYGRSFVESEPVVKCRFAFGAIAQRYVDARRLSNRLGIGISAFGVSGVRWWGARLAAAAPCGRPDQEPNIRPSNAGAEDDVSLTS
jgi:hypothetical protein